VVVVVVVVVEVVVVVVVGSEVVVEVVVVEVVVVVAGVISFRLSKTNTAAINAAMPSATAILTMVERFMTGQ
jgi:hypothetical protein